MKVFLIFATTRERMLKMAMEDLAQTRPRKGKGLQDPTFEQERCPHPVKYRQNRGNKYARLSVCGICSLRLTYESTVEAQKKEAARVKAKEEEIAASVPAAAGGQASKKKNTEEYSKLVAEQLVRMMATQMTALTQVKTLVETINGALDPELSAAPMDAEYVWGESADWSLGD